jgi:hypothetical protein
MPEMRGAVVLLNLARKGVWICREANVLRKLAGVAGGPVVTEVLQTSTHDNGCTFSSESGVQALTVDLQVFCAIH